MQKDEEENHDGFERGLQGWWVEKGGRKGGVRDGWAFTSRVGCTSLSLCVRLSLSVSLSLSLCVCVCYDVCVLPFAMSR